MNRTGRIALWSAAGVLTIGSVAGVAYAAAPPPAAADAMTAALQTFTVDNPTEVPQEGVRHHLRRGLHRLGAHGLHGEFVVQTKGGTTRTVAVQRGKVTAVDGDSLTVTSTDGFEQTWTLNDSTRVRKDGEQADITALVGGDWVGVIGEKSGDGLTAAGVRVPRERPDAEAVPEGGSESTPSSGSLGRLGGRDTTGETTFFVAAAES